MNLPKISVIIPVYNRITYLKDAVEAAVNQTLAPHEVLIVDDGSVKEVAEELDKLCGEYPYVRVIHLPANKGVSAARNAGLRQATGDYVVFLDDDDLLAKNYFNNAVEVMLEQQTADVFVGLTSLIGDPGKRLSKLQKYNEGLAKDHHQVADPLYFLRYCPAIHAMLFKRSAIANHAFPEDISYGEDRLWLLQLKAAGLSFHTEAMVVAFYRIHREHHQLGDTAQFLKTARSMLTHPLQKAHLNLLEAHFARKSGKFLLAAAAGVKALRQPQVVWQAFQLL